MRQILKLNKCSKNWHMSENISEFNNFPQEQNMSAVVPAFSANKDAFANRGLPPPCEGYPFATQEHLTVSPTPV